MHLTTGEPPDEETVDGSKGQLALFRSFACALHIVQKPANLRTRKVWVKKQASSLGEEPLMPCGLELGAERGGAAVLPDDRLVDWLSCPAVPDDHCFALVGDANRSHILRLCLRLPDCRFCDCDDTGPDLFRVMFDPTRLRVELPELLLSRS